MTTRPKPQVLCVDDETRVIESLALLLRKDYDVHLASSGADGLRKMADIRDLAVVISDMRMPVMDGASFLHEVMLRRPDATRIVLTGEAGREGAVRAVNEGQVFRFLTKPCPIDQLRSAIEAGVIQHRVVLAERAVLQETLIGAIKALMEVLAIANPAAYGRANRIKRLVMNCAEKHGCAKFWQLEAAALLSQVGYVGLSPTLLEKLHLGEALTPAEEAQVAALGDGTIGLGTRILGIVLDHESQVSHGKSRNAIFENLRARTARYGATVIAHLEGCVVAGAQGDKFAEIPLRHVRPGMTLQQEIRTHLGALIVPKGFEVTQTFLQRVANIAPELLDTTVRVSAAEAGGP